MCPSEYRRKFCFEKKTWFFVVFHTFFLNSQMENRPQKRTNFLVVSLNIDENQKIKPKNKKNKTKVLIWMQIPIEKMKIFIARPGHFFFSVMFFFSENFLGHIPIDKTVCFQKLLQDMTPKSDMTFLFSIILLLTVQLLPHFLNISGKIGKHFLKTLVVNIVKIQRNLWKTTPRNFTC